MKIRTLLSGFGVFAVFIAACQTTTPEASKPAPSQTTDLNAVSTSVALTVEAELAKVAAALPTETPLPPTNTPIPPPPTATATVPPTPTETVVAKFENHAEFIADVNFPDGTKVAAGDVFTKTWRIKNIGRNTWTTEYSFVFVNGDRMDGFAIKMPEEVLPGQIVDISIRMTAPQEAGTYTGFWMLSDPEDQVFGIGDEGNQALFVQIEVLPGTSTPTPTATEETSRLLQTRSTASTSLLFGS